MELGFYFFVVLLWFFFFFFFFVFGRKRSVTKLRVRRSPILMCYQKEELKKNIMVNIVHKKGKQKKIVYPITLDEGFSKSVNEPEHSNIRHKT